MKFGAGVAGECYGGPGDRAGVEHSERDVRLDWGGRCAGGGAQL